VEDLPDDDDTESTELEDLTTAIFELEDESEETKMRLMIFCFFEDLHRIQDFLHEAWKKY
jgi:mRNA degradation ribonuclease J1/J2